MHFRHDAWATVSIPRERILRNLRPMIPQRVVDGAARRAFDGSANRPRYGADPQAPIEVRYGSASACVASWARALTVATPSTGRRIGRRAPELRPRAAEEGAAMAQKRSTLSTELRVGESARASGSVARAHTHTHARTHARTHTHTHARTHTHTPSSADRRAA